MKAAVYNRWLHQKGGGERHTVMAARVLTERFDTELITHRPIGRDELAEALHIDLDGIGIRVIPALPPNRFAEVTREYDLFVNASFMTNQPSAAPHSLMLVLFPSPIDHSRLARLRQAIGRFLTRELLLPEWSDGFYDVQELGRGWFRYATDRACIKMRVPGGRKPIPIEIVAGNFQPDADLPVRCLADGTLIADHSFAPRPGAFEAWRIDVDRRFVRDGLVELTLESPTFNPTDRIAEADNREVGLAVTDVRVRHPRHFLYELLFRRMFRELGLRLEGLPAFYSLDHLETYDMICPISEYSRAWMEVYWGCSGPLLYPPVDTSWARPRTKTRTILSVGRFFRGTHEKKHGVMIDQFIRMCRDGLQDWTLLLAGHQSRRDIDLAYTDELRRRAAGHPIEFAVDAPFADLQRFYGEAQIYWHAAGYGERVERNPIKFEHFGISVVEAMANEAVPVVLNQGGPPELVHDGHDGFLWSSTGELRERTWRLVHDLDMRARMARRARESSERFNTSAFRERLNTLVTELVDDAP
ncbi:MAG: glycosyltransferase [Chloroflexota bacterium]|nr:glycosyltransferase [Chloroflexota bacterium]MDE2918427.1 glycosyltransferase [Chloroflexota bacterium]